MRSFHLLALAVSVLTFALNVAAVRPMSMHYRRSFGTREYGVEVNLRIEGKTDTIFEGTIVTNAEDVTTPSGGTHKCDGTNDGANLKPNGTCTTALQDAARQSGFSFDGWVVTFSPTESLSWLRDFRTFDSQFDDFFITAIGDSAETATQFWGLLLNYQFTPVGGCQQEVAVGDDVLWAFDAFNKSYFLELSVSSQATAVVGGHASFTVIDGTTGIPIAGAVVAVVGDTSGSETATTDASGVAVITFVSSGAKSFKASRDDSIRSDAIQITVS
jgi:hypothetical protein